MMMVMRRRRSMQQISSLLSLSRRGSSQDQQVGNHSLSSFVHLHTHTNKQTNKESFNKQRILSGSLCEEAPSSLDLSELHRQGHEGVLRTWPAKIFKISFFLLQNWVFELGEKADLPLSYVWKG